MKNNLAGLLQQISVRLSEYLEKTLPDLFDNWWQEGVLDTLSFSQKRWAEQRQITSLTDLDLAALLRVMDENWYRLSQKMNFLYEDRHFLKEMRTIRNRWAHADAKGFSSDDVYRDLDTIQRFAKLIGANDTFLQKVKSEKTLLLQNKNTVSAQAHKIKKSTKTEIKKSKTAFSPGEIVVLKSNPNTRGAIVSVSTASPENRYSVFINGELQVFYTSQIQLDKTNTKNKKFLFLPHNKFHAYLTSLQIRYPGLSTLYSLNAARIDFIPYQFRPVMKFIHSDRPRLLIADSVGVGKTIEAGLILRELQARRDINSVLIISPRSLVVERKWQLEMRRFEEKFIHLDGKALRYCVKELDAEGVWPAQYQKAIVPYSLFDETLLYGADKESKRKYKKGLLDLEPPPRFDLVIVDEAHHIRNTETFRHKAVRFFCDNAEAVVFLTATPIQLGSQDLFVLLNVLRPDLIIDKESFEHMAEPNPFLNLAVKEARIQEPQWRKQVSEALEKAEHTAWGQALLKRNPDFIRIKKQLSHDKFSPEERIKLINDIENQHTFSRIINRTRRRDIGDFTIRKPETVRVNFTPEQREFHNSLLKIQAKIFRRLHGDQYINFMMTTIRRQAASCLYGLAPFLRGILSRHMDELSWDEVDNTLYAPPQATVDPIKIQIKTILKQAENLPSFDPKLNALKNILKDKEKLKNNKVMLFSSFRHTLHYLYQHLLADGLRVGVMHGGTPDEERVELRNRFEMERTDNRALDILLFSEIGSEGLDYQFCDCIVNYDLPWNPMRIEQRIGRIDRNGQQSESIAIYNLITPDTVDADIYERCLLRIGVFNHALGDGEEILGEISQNIRSIAENFTLNDEERKEKLQQLADNQIRDIQEQERLEEKQIELFGIQLPEAQIKREIDDASSFWLSPDAIKKLVTLYLQRGGDVDQEFILGEKPRKTLRLSQEVRNRLLEDFRLLPDQNTALYREWEIWLKGGDPHLSITFDAKCASRYHSTTFITPVHPLVKQAANANISKEKMFTSLSLKDENIPDGNYPFVIYQWQFYGIREDLKLRPISTSKIITEQLDKLLEKAEAGGREEDIQVANSTWDELDTHHYKIWSDARKKHNEQTKELAQYRRESLETSHKARMALLNEQLVHAKDEKINRMRESQINTAQADYARRIQELDIAMERADIAAQPVAYGIINVGR